MTLYELFLTVHVVGAICWVGGGTLLQILGTRTINSNNPEQTRDFVASTSYLGPRFFIPISLTTVVFGVLTVVEGDISFGDLWVSAGLTMFVISFILGAGVVGPSLDKLVEMDENGELGSTTYTKTLGRVLLVSRIELVLLWAIVVLMILKPS
jgi:uncharacterized membrane protein